MVNLIRKNFGIVIVTIVYIIITGLMLPLRDQALDDDFAYIQTTDNLYKTGVLKVSDWSSATMVFQPYWGTLFYRIFGHKISNLHLSNIVLFYFALIAFYLLLRRIKLKEWNAVVFSLFLLGFPWIFQFIYSYMSDTFYVSLMIISLYFSVRGLQDKDIKYLLLGSLFAGFAFLNRQIGITLVISMVITLLYKGLSGEKITVKQLLSSLLPVGIIVALYSLWINKVGLTAFQYVTIGPNFKKQFTNLIFPFRPGQIGGVNSFYIEFLVQRAAQYMSVLVGSIFPILLIYKVGVSRSIEFVKLNKKTIIFSLLAFACILILDNVYGNKFSRVAPNDLIYRFSIFDWKKVWPTIFIIFTPPVVIILGIYVKKFINFVMIPKKNLNSKIFKYLIYAVLTFDVFLFLQVVRQSYAYLFNPIDFARNTSKLYIMLSGYTNAFLDRKILNELFTQTSFFFLIFTGLAFIIAYLIASRKLAKLKKEQFPLLFISLISIGHMILVLIFAYFFWEEYILQLSPFFVLGAAYLFRNVQLAKVRTVIVISLFLLFSLHITRNRYQDTGIRWEMATKLVENYGVSPLNVSDPSWGWRPWWYFESSFAEKVSAVGGDKYKVAQIGGAWNNATAPGDIYKIDIVPNDKTVDSKTVLISEPFWYFWGVKRLGATKTN